MSIETEDAVAVKVARTGQEMIDRNLDRFMQADDETVMSSAVKAFNTLTGGGLSESEGWLLMSLVSTSYALASPGGDVHYAARASMSLAMMANAQAVSN
jgi:hypothetical protein